MRFDFLQIEKWVTEETHILDLGCGDGSMLAHLNKTKQVSSLGIEIDEKKITACIKNGIDVIEQNIDEGLENFSNNSFDMVLLTYTLQAVHRPDYVLKEMLRIGKECIVAFPNFGYWHARRHLLMRGKMPVSKFMPYSWYDTPNIHFCTVKDFEIFCEQNAIKILKRNFQVNHGDNSSNKSFLAIKWPNLFATHALYKISS